MYQFLRVILPLLVLSFGVHVRGQPAGDSTNQTRTAVRATNGYIIAGNGQIWGTWRNREICPSGTYATGFSLRVDKNQGSWGDDTALNGIALRCTPPRTPSSLITSYTTVKSDPGSWGQWTQNKWCKTGQLVAFQLRVEPNRGLDYDNTAANNIRFRCSGNQVLEGDGLAWGSWSSWSPNCAGRGICGIQTKVENPQGTLDDTALNDVRFYCCN